MPRKSLTSEHLLESCPALSRLLADDCRITVAFSGGCDSMVLLHLLTQLIPAQFRGKRLRALHINHQLQEDASAWVKACRRFCRSLGVPLRTVSLDPLVLRHTAGESLESAAREGRYAVFRQLLRSREVLLQAHHADDQMETMLFRLLRGSGPEGLAGIPEQRQLGRGLILRPLLSWSREQIEHYARDHDLEWVEDPSNLAMDFDRNYLRHEVLPALNRRWPAGRDGFLRSGQLLLDAAACNAALAAEDSEKVCAGTKQLTISTLQELPEFRQRNLLHGFLQAHCRMRGVPQPDFVSLQRVMNEVLTAVPSASPVVRWPKGRPQTEVRRYDNRLYVMPCLPDIPADHAWSGRNTLDLGKGLGKLRLVACEEEGFVWTGGRLTVRFSVQGLKITRAGRPSRTLGRLCQELRLPPWERQRLPLLFENDRLLSVGDLLVPDDALQKRGKKRYRLEWLREELH